MSAQGGPPGEEPGQEPPSEGPRDETDGTTPVTPIPTASEARAGLAAPQPAGASSRLAVDRRMLESLVCPATQSALDYDRERQELISRQAGLAYPIRDGIPVLLVGEARKL